ncbi:ABC transporter permease [Ruminococcaceae bacterium OttesenSCG-928-A11]|nr:ABC transporter permease [Ruminococcaceae bacterium OttesenSCG-928-A11]
MLKFIGKRLLLMIPVLIGVSFIIFSIMSLTPGDPAMLILGEGATPEALAAKRVELGLDKSFVERYLIYLFDAVRGDFGTSYRTGISVVQEIITRLPYTLTLASICIILAVIIGIPIGVLSAVKQYSVVDIGTLTVSLLLTSMPEFFTAMLLILLFSLKLGWLPLVGIESWKSWVMPVLAGSASTIAAILRMTRSSMLEVVRQDYIRTARAKGASERQVIFHHALRNSLLPVVTVIGVNFGVALGGSIVLEQVFSIPGLGLLMINAIRTKDTPMVMAAVLFAAIIASVVNLLVDITYTFIDPRLGAQYASRRRKKVRA